MADPPGRRRRAHGLRARRRTDELALAQRARARLERVLPRSVPTVARGGSPTPAGGQERSDDQPAGRTDEADHRRLGGRADDGPVPSAADDSGPPRAMPDAGAPRLSRPAVLGVVLVCLVGLLVAGLHVVRARPAPVDVATPVRSLPPSVRATATVVVDVAGAVRRPGVYTLSAGARVGEALARAGGPATGADTSSLNLARVLADGEQVLVPQPGAAGAAASAPAAGGGAGGAVLDLNTATLDQLESLPGVGPVLGQRILDWRQAHGRFSSVDELREVSGVGDRKFTELRPLVRV